jgi:malonyl-CoA/methylmalonyl-CoA synthetase
MDDSGRVTLLGREKDIVISGGENIYPAELETAILGKAIAPEVAIIGVPHPDLGEAVVAVTQRQVDVDDADLTDIAAFKRPKAWVTVGELPRNAMGKVQKQELRERFKGLFD